MARVARVGAFALGWVVVGIGAYYGVVRADVLRVAEIRVSGLQRLTPAEIDGLVAGVRGTSLAGLDLDRVRALLLASPWIERASVRRIMPWTLELTVVERVPIAVARFPSGLFLLDASGAIVEEFGPHHADLDLPLVDGFDVVPRPGVRVEPARAALLARLLQSLQTGSDLRRRLSQVNVSDDRNAVVMLEGDPALLHLGQERLAERLQAYVDMAPALRERVESIDYIDLRFEERVYLRPLMAKARTDTAPLTSAPVAEPDAEPDPMLNDDAAPPEEPTQ